ncbi:Cytochrome P450 [Quadrisphaera granulorum]|uniref:Cytochrome P450 n=1 Tax=Quadrisphaera granulorum TaxID=317664 RepID=A0A316AC42_9ACTN|nr:cytochrome P450 [Quadrisphaera granulorum]PWJ55346.1 cytochrome P450 [Quadrisphaera granulorum]SZE95410.1 Cytochrome P450 [Quadrisphaera granulorum]
MTTAPEPVHEPWWSTLPVVPEDPYADEHLADPYPLFRRMQDLAPVVWLAAHGVAALTRDAECRQVLRDHETFISGAGVGPKDLRVEAAWRQQGILELDPPAHTSLRTAMSAVLSPRGVRSLRSQLVRTAEELVDDVLGAAPGAGGRTVRLDGVTDLAEPYPLRAFGDAVGIPRDGRHEHLLPHGAMNFSAFGPDNARSAQFFAAGADSREWVMRNCARENLAPGGLGWQVWELADRGDITPTEATLLVRAMLSAGLDTTVIAIGNALAALSRRPDAWARLRADPSLVKFALDEVLRLESPFQSFYRTVAREADIGGTTLPADTKVALFVGAANRDPRRWGPDADAFDLDRSSAGHLAFGMGIHQCVGQLISRLEAETLLGLLVARVERLEPLAPGQPFLHTTLRGWSSLPLALTLA